MLTMRDRLVELAGTGKLIRFTTRGDSNLLCGRIVRVGIDYAEIDCVDEQMELYAAACVPLAEINWLDVNPVAANRKLLSLCLGGEAPSVKDDGEDMQCAR